MCGNVGRLVAGCVVLVLSTTHVEALDDVLQLFDAVKRGDRAAVQKLLKSDLDVSARWGDGTTALHWAVHRERPRTATARCSTM
jgi:ankyrin repeat protein